MANLLSKWPFCFNDLMISLDCKKCRRLNFLRASSTAGAVSLKNFYHFIRKLRVRPIYYISLIACSKQSTKTYSISPISLKCMFFETHVATKRMMAEVLPLHQLISLQLAQCLQQTCQSCQIKKDILLFLVVCIYCLT